MRATHARRRLGLALAALAPLACHGCSLGLRFDRDFVDESLDAGTDAGTNAAADAGTDAALDARPTPDAFAFDVGCEVPVLDQHATRSMNAYGVSPGDSQTVTVGRDGYLRHVEFAGSSPRTDAITLIVRDVSLGEIEIGRAAGTIHRPSFDVSPPIQVHAGQLLRLELDMPAITPAPGLEGGTYAGGEATMDLYPDVEDDFYFEMTVSGCAP